MPTPFARTAVCAAALIAAGPATADVTAREVWEDWQARLSTGALSLTQEAAEVSDARVLVTGARLAVDGAEMDATVDLGRIEMTSAGDGTVAVTLSPEIPVALAFPDGARASLTLGTVAQALSIGGTPGAMRHDLSADRLSLTLVGATDVDGTAIEADMRLGVEALALSAVPEAGALPTYGTSLRADSLELLIDTPVEEDQRAVISMKADAPSAETDVTLPPDTAGLSGAEALRRGFALDGSIGYAGVTYISDMGGAAVSVSGGAGQQSLSLSGEGAVYDARLQDVRVVTDVPELPQPARIAVGSYDISASGPVLASETPAPFALRYRIDDLTLAEEVWALADPQGVIPRDPASLAIDLAGSARLDVSPLEDEATVAAAPRIGELLSLDVNRIGLALAGATLEAAGGFTFEEGGPFDSGMTGSPVGSVTVDVTGVNRLIDGAIALGLVQADQAMMGRMMLGMFAEATGEDSLRSRIEVTPDGRVTVNGQQIR